MCGFGLCVNDGKHGAHWKNGNEKKHIVSSRENPTHYMWLDECVCVCSLWITMHCVIRFASLWLEETAMNLLKLCLRSKFFDGASIFYI